jgi:Ca-activated chloride channel family protein
MLPMTVRTLVAAAALLAATTDRPAGGRIEGVVRNQTGAALANAQVMVLGAALATTTSNSGFYAVTNVPPGTYSVRAQFIGYAPAEVRGVRVREGQTSRIDITLRAATQETEAVAARDQVARPAAAVAPGFATGAEGFRHRREPWNTEEYGTIDENPFLAVAANPLSTFSVDVDRASYSNVRRFLLNGQLPPRDAVRIEELVNYFPYAYAAPSGDDPVAIHAEIAPAPWKPQHRLVRIGLQARRIATEGLPPSNLVFLLDVSGSMQPPNKLPLLKSAFGLLVNNLRPEDRVAIVVYAGSAGLVLPSTPGDQKAKILEAIERLEAGGSTAGGAGIRRAYDEATVNFIRRGNNRVILATDGDFNVGVSSESQLVQLIEERRRTGVFLTVLGFGHGNLKDSKMEMLADRGNGQYFYIDNLLEARKALVTELGGTLYTVAKDVKLQIEWNPARVRAYRLIGYENRLLRDEDFADDSVDAGDVGSGHSVTALYEVVPVGVETDVVIRLPDSLRYQTTPRPSAASAGPELVFVKVRYKAPDGDRSRLLSRPVRDDATDPSSDFRFQAAVAEFGLVLRNSPHRGRADLGRVIATARGALGDDPDGYRAEFVRLVQAAQSLGAGREMAGR